MHMKRWTWQSDAKKIPELPERPVDNDGDGIGDSSASAPIADPQNELTVHLSNQQASFSGGEEEHNSWNRPVIFTIDQQSNWRRSSNGSDGLDISDKENQTDHRVLPSPVRLGRPSPLAAANTFWTSSSPRQSFPIVEGIQKLSITPTGLSATGLDDYCKHSDSVHSPLYPLEEVTLSSSSEEIPPMRITNESSKIQQEPASRALSACSLEESIVSNELKWSDPSSSLHSSYQSISSPSKIVVSSQNEERKCLKGVATVDPFEWAYVVWRRKGLLRDSQTSSRVSGVSSLQLRPSVNVVARDNRHSKSQDNNDANSDFISPRSQSTKPWSNDQKKFSNILERWKTQTENQPLYSPGSCTVLQVHHLNELSKPISKRSLDRQTIGVVTNPKANVARRNSLHVVERSVKHPSSSIPLAQKVSPPRDVTQPTRSTPKSQAWRLKTARDLRMLQEKHLKRDKERSESINPSQGRNLVEVKVPDEHIHASTSRSTSQLRNTQLPSSLSVTNVVEAIAYKRTQSQPRSFRRNTVAQCGRRGADPSVENEPLRVCDLKIDVTQDESFDIPIQISYVPLEEQCSHSLRSLGEDAELFSPYTQRVMRNLAKVYDESEDVKTPRGSDSHHPWQHDRLLHRVDCLAENLSGDTSCKCSCVNSVFSGNDDMVEFFLPLMGSACSCGGKAPGLIMPEQPTSLVNILRPWQVSFLGRFGIYFGEELVKSFHRSGAALAKALQQHRKKQGMTPFPLKSCVMALQIWSKTSKTFVRSIREQLSHYELEGNTSSSGKDVPSTLKVPNTLYLLSSFMDKMPSDKFLLQTSGNVSNDSL
jgi:hypothetical protein